MIHLLRIDNLHFSYRENPYIRLSVRENFLLRSLTNRPKPSQEFALRDINLALDYGESLGLIGLNGSGKSTLLKLIAGIYKPKIGSVMKIGSCIPIIDLGFGFHRTLSGRQNVRLVWTLVTGGERLTEFDVEDIFHWAELGEYIDTPIREYSRGMLSRLSFAIATHKYSDLLLIDEVLSVGDEKFAIKAHERLQELRKSGTSLIFTTHNLTILPTYASRCIWLQDGKIIADGESTEIVTQFRKLF